jgi:hypothetical protein
VSDAHPGAWDASLLRDAARKYWRTSTPQGLAADDTPASLVVQATLLDERESPVRRSAFVLAAVCCMAFSSFCDEELTVSIFSCHLVLRRPTRMRRGRWHGLFSICNEEWQVFLSFVLVF